MTDRAPLDLRAVEALSGEAKGVASIAVQLNDRSGPLVWDRLNPREIAELLERLAASQDTLLAALREARAVLDDCRSEMQLAAGALAVVPHDYDEAIRRAAVVLASVVDEP